MVELYPKSKINLGLEILRKRDDGYHELNTMFYETEPSDKMTITRYPRFYLVCKPSLGIPSSKNIIGKAYAEIQKYRKKIRVVKEMKPLENLFNYQALIRLQKNIPVGAGLGGGSSDCAAALKGLNEFWEIGLPDDKLIRIGAKLGSDVPFFIRGGAALARGRGEVLQFVDFKLPYTILIVNPGIHISTKEAYSKVKIKNRSKPTDLLTEWKNNVNNPKALREAIVNDFEDSVFSSYPELKKLKTKLYHRGAVFALLSGSGSSLFGLFKSVETASKAASNFPQYYTYICNVG